MRKRHLIVIDITGRQSEDMETIVKTIRALHNIAYGYNALHEVSVTEDEYEQLQEKEIEK